MFFLKKKSKKFKVVFFFGKCFLNYSFKVHFGHTMNVDLLHNLVGKEKNHENHHRDY